MTQFRYTLDISYPARFIHIYNSKREFNVITSTGGNPDIGDVIGKIYFVSNDKVSMIRVNNKGIADYDHPVFISIDTNCNADDPDFIKQCSLAFGVYAKVMAKVINYMASIGSKM